MSATLKCPHCGETFQTAAVWRKSGYRGVWAHRTAEILAMHSEGKSCAAIAKHLRNTESAYLGMMEPAHVKYILQRLECTLAPTAERPNFTERNAKIVEMRSRGMTLAAIGAEFGISKSRVRKILFVPLTFYETDTAC